MSRAFSPSTCMDLVWSDWGTSWLDPWATSFSVGKLSRLSNCHQHSACPPASTFFWWCWTGNGRVNSLTCWATSSFQTLCFAQRLRQAMLPSLTTKVPRLRMCFTILFLLDATSLSGDTLLDMTQLEWILEFLITSSNPKITSGINNNVCNHICKKKCIPPAHTGIKNFNCVHPVLPDLRLIPISSLVYQVIYTTQPSPLPSVQTWYQRSTRSVQTWYQRSIRSVQTWCQRSIRKRTPSCVPWRCYDIVRTRVCADATAGSF